MVNKVVRQLLIGLNTNLIYKGLVIFAKVNINMKVFLKTTKESKTLEMENRY